MGECERKREVTKDESKRKEAKRSTTHKCAT